VNDTVFSTLAEALPVLYRLEAEQLETRRVMIESGRAYDSRRMN